MTLFSRILFGLLALGLASCDALPGVAPTATQLIRSKDENWDVYVVKVTSLVSRALASYRPESFPAGFRSQNYTPSIALKPGDAIGITVYETAGSALFQGTVPALMTGTPGLAAPQPTTIPLQVVESDGKVTVPYVGRVSVAGRTPAQAAAIIQENLSSQTVRPQVVVSIAGNVSNTISVGGEVNRSGLMPLTLRGERLLDAVAWAGGPKQSAIQMDLRLMRAKQTFSVPLTQIMSNAEDNILVQPNDNVSLVFNPKTYLVMGATQKVNQYAFDVETITLAEALARAGGGVETITNLAAIYLFRYEPAPLARKVLTVDHQAVDTQYVTSRVDTLEAAGSIPFIYRIDLTQAGGYFSAQQIQLRNKDIVVLATAEAAQFLKLMQVIRAVSGTYYDLTRSSNY
ncbi:MAG: polysaccharide biosynthesis/export family protein [Reyranella sp.]